MENTTTKPAKLVEYAGWYGMTAGVAGEAIIVLNLGSSWVLAAIIIWLTSNVAWGYYALKTRARHLLILQSIYVVFNIIGLFRW